MTRAVLPAKLKLRNDYKLLATKCSWSNMLYIEGTVEEDLEWWIEALESWNGAPIHVKTPEIQITTDASSSGWGGIVLNSNNKDLIGMSASSMWSRMISHKPSKYRELLTIIVTLE